jgi:hypothetical protein
MVNNCANPRCNKPLHYLRDGRIFVFEVMGDTVGSDGKRSRHLEHYWLCGDCAPTMILERDADAGVQLMPKPILRNHREEREPALAS